MLRSALIVLLLGASLSASAVPIATVRSAVGEADVRNATARDAWMPQVSANPVFQHGRVVGRAPSLAVDSVADAVPLRIDVTSLRPGETRLAFAGTRDFVSTRASFLTRGP
jgi:hypothetical protein